MKKIITLVCMLNAIICSAQKVAVIGMNHVSPDGFTFVVTEELVSGNVVYFTENEYADASNSFNNLTEAVVAFTANGTITKGSVVFVSEISTDVFSVNCTGNTSCGSAVKTSSSSNFALATEGEGLYAYSDVDNDPSNGITEIFSVLYDGNADQVPNVNGGLIPAGQNPINDFPNAIVVEGFSAITPGRTEYNITTLDRTDVTKLQLENPSNYLHGLGNAALSITPFTNFLPNIALPIMISNFSARIDGQNHLLNWSTTMEQSNAFFKVQRSPDANKFSTIDNVDTKALNGNSNAVINYEAQDEHPQMGHNYYRLQQVDLNGKFTYSQVIDIYREANGNVVSMYPNPTQGILNIAYFMLQEGISKIKLSDMSGRILKEIQVNSNKGINTFQLEVNELAKGMYMLQTIRSGQEISTQKFEKQ